MQRSNWAVSTRLIDNLEAQKATQQVPVQERAGLRDRRASGDYLRFFFPALEDLGFPDLDFPDLDFPLPFEALGFEPESLFFFGFPADFLLAFFFFFGFASKRSFTRRFFFCPFCGPEARDCSHSGRGLGLPRELDFSLSEDVDRSLQERSPLG